MEQLSPADQAAIEKINDEYNEKMAKLWVALDNKAKEFATGKGVTFIPISAERTNPDGREDEADLG